MNSILGSIVVFNPKWNLLTQTIDSFLESAPQAKVVIWDNSPSDDLNNKIRDHYTSDNVTYKKSPDNYGYGRGNNEVFKKYGHDFDYFCVLNPDLKIPKETIPQLLTHLADNKHLGLITGNICGLDDKPHAVHKLFSSFIRYTYTFIAQKVKILPTLSSNEQFINMTTPYSLPHISGCFMLFTKDHYRDLSGFDERFFLYFEDFDISLRSYLKNKSVILPTAKIHHDWHRQSHKSMKIFKIHLNSAFMFYQKWGFGFRVSRSVNKSALDQLKKSLNR